ncbi:MAG: cytochrome c [Saprospiraceae bacterium]|nr:cytochrome c [Saprospiraceae bacterium]
MRLIRYISLAFIFVFGLSTSAYSAGDPAVGQTIFANQCGSCHNRNMKDNLTGPALGGVQGRWESEADLYAWIRNSQAMIAKGHPRSVELWNQWKPTVMNNFTGLTDDEIAGLLAYIDGVYTGTYPPKVAGAEGEAVVVEDKGINVPLFIVLFVILALLAVVLARIISKFKLHGRTEGW